MDSDAKLYVVTRRDLTHGRQAAQLLHAFREFVADHQDVEGLWYRTSNTVALLAVTDEAELMAFLDGAKRLGIRVSSFREPDLNNALTAIAIEPAGAKFLSEVRPAFR